MNEIIRKKLEMLSAAKNFECWYLVKHSTDFGNLCYLVYVLEKYKDTNQTISLEQYIKNEIKLLNENDKNNTLSDNYRALRVAAYFGLITMKTSSYVDAEITSTYVEIKEKCGGNFEQTSLYDDVICRQIEKMFISSMIDEEKDGVRSKFRLYPVMLLYKVLIELGRTTGLYRISTTEYRYLVATTERFEDYLDTIVLIKLLRKESEEVVSQFDCYRSKFDNRMNVALQRLRTLRITPDGIEIKPEFLSEVSRKVHMFEENFHHLDQENYLEFLGSSNSMFDLLNPEKEENDREQSESILNHNLFAIHIKRKNDALDERNPHICIGWSELGDLSQILSKEDLKSLYNNTYAESKKNSASINVGQIWRFLNESKIGDYVILAEPKFIHIGRIESEYFFDSKKRENQDEDYVNNRKIKWLIKDFDRKKLSLNFHHSLGVSMSYFAINDYRAVVFDILNNRYSKEEMEEDTSMILDECERLRSGENVILYGVPGVGKSWTIDNEYTDESTVKERVVFHPDYTYSDFVGQILPKSNDGDVSYEFIPGPFTKIVNEAYHNPLINHILVIEEINRGNAPAIFGDIFQLLDRNPITHESAYEITNSDMAKIVYENENHKVKIPSNLSIICTMNTSDQNVFTLDTAFQRRWNMRLVENTFKKDSAEEKFFAEHKILDTEVTWEEFCDAINTQILEKNQNMTSSEDKRVGTHFVNIEDLVFDDNEQKEEIDIETRNKARRHNRRFPEKVIKYLWDDAFKFYRDEIFKTEFNSLEKVINEFVQKNKNDRFNIFKDNIKAAIEEKSKKK
ncbi:MAG: AAA family ATPase [Anaeroplasma bactoclasticum]|nr:AAA family ATPase [Anaeroplasma bactoclasticum]